MTRNRNGLAGSVAREEDAQRQRVDLTLAHHAERRPRCTVDDYRDVGLAAGVAAGQPDRAQVDVALLTQVRPDGAGVHGERFQAGIADVVRALLQP